MSRSSAGLLLFSLVTTVAADKECFCGTLHSPTYMGDACETDVDCTNAHESVQRLANPCPSQTSPVQDASSPPPPLTPRYILQLRRNLRRPRHWLLRRQQAMGLRHRRLWKADRHRRCVQLVCRDEPLPAVVQQLPARSRGCVRLIWSQSEKVKNIWCPHASLETHAAQTQRPR